MGAKRKPRRQSKAVYRRRRLVIVLFSLVLIAGVAVGATLGIRWLVDAKPWENLPFVGDEPVAEESPDPIPTIYPTAAPQSPGPSPSSTPEPEPEACAPGALELVAQTNKNEYASDEDPKLSMVLTNVGEVDCIVDVGTGAQKFTVASGADEWWRSTDCQQDAQENWVTIAAGQTVESSDPLTWNRTRSYSDTCDADERPSAVGGGSTYALTVELGGAVSQPTSFILH